MKVKKYLASIFFICSFNASAGTIEAGPFYLDSITVIGVSAFGHQAGNIEIKITNGHGNPAGISCDSNYVATKSSVTGYQAILSTLLAAQAAQKPVRLGLTDDPSLTAFGGRCSLVSVTLLK